MDELLQERYVCSHSHFFVVSFSGVSCLDSLLIIGSRVKTVVEDRPIRPVDDAWAKRHNQRLIVKLLKASKATKEEKEVMRKEMEEDL